MKENPAYSLYNIQLEDEGDDEEWALQENIKGKYIKAINKEEDAEEEQIMEELKQLIKLSLSNSEICKIISGEYSIRLSIIQIESIRSKASGNETPKETIVKDDTHNQDLSTLILNIFTS